VGLDTQFSFAVTVNMDDPFPGQIILQQSDGSNYICVIGIGQRNNLATAIWESNYVARVSPTSRRRTDYGGVRFDSRNDSTDRPSGDISVENMIGRRSSGDSFGAVIVVNNTVLTPCCRIQNVLTTTIDNCGNSTDGRQLENLGLVPHTI
jgi:hypothetical protein